MKYQTRYPGFIRRDGCLLCSLVTLVEQAVGRSLDDRMFLEMIDALHEMPSGWDAAYPVLSDELDVRLQGAYVWDHAAVANETSRRIGSARRLRYIGRRYMPHYLSATHTDFGRSAGADAIILQVRTITGQGHFRLLDFDPWEGGTQAVDLKSVRYYAWDVD